MIIALLALALAMILGGLASAVMGWDIILVERGWTMVIAGSVFAGSGALLLGITAAISKLARIQSELSRLQGGFAGEGSHVLSPSSDMLRPAPSVSLPDGSAPDRADGPEPVEDPERVTQLAGTSVYDRSVETIRSEPDEEISAQANIKPPAPVLPFRSRSPSDPANPSSEDEDQEAKVPDFLLGDRHREAGADTRISDEDESLYAPEPAPQPLPEPVPEPVPAPAEPEPEVIETRSEAPVPAVEDDAEPEEARPVTIVGTYNSGDNKYVMFSDGSIEAQTPGGVFTFKSLDELKEFIASGGEGNSSAST